MRNVLLLCTLVIFSSACVTAQSDNKTDASATPVVETSSIPSLLPSSNPSEEVRVKIVNRTATKLKFSDMRKVKLSEQPETIIKSFAFLEYDTILPKDKELQSYADRTEIYLTERDINHDGKPEKLYFDPMTSSKNPSYPSVSIFRLEGKKWKILTTVSADISADDSDSRKHPGTIEFLSSGIIGDFDIIKNTEKTFSDDTNKIMIYYRYFEFDKNGFDAPEIDPGMEDVFSKDAYKQINYENYLCNATTDGKIDETIPCVQP